jgi:hypothetical protein
MPWWRVTIADARRNCARALAEDYPCQPGRQAGNDGKRVSCVRPVYGWFTEGFDTADLRDAKELL